MLVELVALLPMVIHPLAPRVWALNTSEDDVTPESVIFPCCARRSTVPPGRSNFESVIVISPCADSRCANASGEEIRDLSDEVLVMLMWRCAWMVMLFPLVSRLPPLILTSRPA